MSALWTAQDAARATGAVLAAGVDWSVDGVSIDTRAIARRDLFVALKGPRFDGHDFVAGALSDGAAAAMVDRPLPSIDPARLLAVKDTQAGLEALAAAARARSGARIAAVTGSVGKTGTKEALAKVLGEQGATHASAGNLNNHIGTPLSLARMPASSRFGVFELGMNHAGEIAPLSRLVKPHAAIVTTVEAAHLEYFAGIEGIADAKAEIFEGMDADGVAILNRDNAQFDRLARRARERGVGRVWSFGERGEEAWLVSASLGPDGSSVEADILGRRVDFRLPPPGRHQVQNALAVLLAVAALEADVEAAAHSLATLSPVKGRGTVHDITVPGGAFRLIDESYNASPAAVRAALDVLGMTPAETGGRRILVLGDMLELGPDGPAAHAALAEAAGVAGAALVFTAGPLSRHLHDALPASLRGGHAADAATLAPIVASAVQPGDLVLVKGSAGSRMATVVQALRDLGSSLRGTPMLYDLVAPYADKFLLANLFRYQTFRTGGAVLTALLVCFVFGPRIIRWLKSRQGSGQPIRTDGPETHLKKQGTPTMGGVMILLAVVVSTLLWVDLRNAYTWIVLFVTVANGAIGFGDDYLKLTKRNAKGLPGRVKLVCQIVIAAAAAVWIAYVTRQPLSTELAFPIFKEAVINLGYFFPVFAVLVIVGTSNAVNLTDGLDGLAIVPVMIAASCFGLIAYLVGNLVFANYLQLLHVTGTGELAVFCGALVGASLGFLWFNAPPAMVFMGDTGSLSVGAALGAIAVVTKHEIVLAIIGGLFVLETVSVIVQVASYKTTGRRVFRMAPLHHHFEKQGWSEPTVVIRFWIIAAILALVGLSTLKLR